MARRGILSHIKVRRTHPYNAARYFMLCVLCTLDGSSACMHNSGHMGTAVAIDAIAEASHRAATPLLSSLIVLGVWSFLVGCCFIVPLLWATYVSCSSAPWYRLQHTILPLLCRSRSQCCHQRLVPVLAGVQRGQNQDPNASQEQGHWLSMAVYHGGTKGEGSIFNPDRR